MYMYMYMYMYMFQCLLVLTFTCGFVNSIILGIGSPTPSEGLLPSSIPLPPTPSSDLTPSKVLNQLLTSASSLTTPSTFNPESAPPMSIDNIKTEKSFSPKSNGSQNQECSMEKTAERFLATSVKQESMEMKSEHVEVKQEPMDQAQTQSLVQTLKQPGTVTCTCSSIIMHMYFHTLYMLYTCMYMYIQC